MGRDRAQNHMNNAVAWMAEQVCPLLPYIGVHACAAGADLYLVGIAGWIFGGVGLLMLMGISEEIETRKVARRPPQMAGAAPLPQPNGDASTHPAAGASDDSRLASRRRQRSRFRHLRRLNPIDSRQDTGKRVQSIHQ